MAKYVKYKIINNSPYDEDLHFEYCEKLMIPYITVRKKTKKYSYVEVDLIAIAQDHGDIMDFIRKDLNDKCLVFMVLKDLKIIKHNSKVYSQLGNCCYAAKILNEYAERFAESLFDFYYDAIQRAIREQKKYQIQSRINNIL